MIERRADATAGLHCEDSKATLQAAAAHRAWALLAEGADASCSKVSVRGLGFCRRVQRLCLQQLHDEGYGRIGATGSKSAKKLCALQDAMSRIAKREPHDAPHKASEICIAPT